ncbi:MAG: hypothetical protein KIT58_13105 [Planctomycetota bacterium]|nr:hypothetical protein [Planctomycetota bacterium]
MVASSRALGLVLGLAGLLLAGCAGPEPARSDAPPPDDEAARLRAEADAEVGASSGRTIGAGDHVPDECCEHDHGPGHKH